MNIIAALILNCWVMVSVYTATTESNPTFVNSVYYLGEGNPTVFDFSNFDLNVATHIKYAFAGIEGNRAVINSTEIKDGNNRVLTGHLGTLIKMKQKYRNLKTGISILGDFGSMVPTESGRKEFVASTIEIMQTYGFDFVDLDWEFPVVGFEEKGVKGNPDDAKYMVALLKEFHDQFKEKLSFKAFMTIALPVPLYFLKHYDIKGIDPYIEYYNCMTYDFTGPASAEAYHASNLKSNITDVLSVEKAVTDMKAAGVPTNKMLIGMPLYAIVFRDMEKKEMFSKFNKNSTLRVGENGYLAPSELDWGEIEINWDDNAKASWGWYKKQNLMVTYDSVQAAEEKINFIKNNNLKGIMVWALHQDYPLKDEKSIIAKTSKLLGVENLEQQQNNIDYLNSPFLNVKDPKAIVKSSSFITSPNALTTLTTLAIFFISLS